MSNEEFCEIYTDFYGDSINNIKQLVQTTMDGEELKELIEFFMKQQKQ